MTDTDTRRFTITSDRGSTLALHRISLASVDSDTPAGEPVLLAHGTFSNHRTCGGLARYLASRGFDCWLIDFEGHGQSNSVAPSADFETLFLSGTRAALQFVSDTTGQRIHWVGHSGGGLAALMAMARQPDTLDQLHSLTMLASQASKAGLLPSHRLILRSFSVLTRLLGHVPAKALKLGPDNENAAVMMQWYKWNLTGQWIGTDGLDYSDVLSQFQGLKQFPILTLAGTGDWFIAPAIACKSLQALLPSDRKTWLECGVQHGYSENYSHARLVSSRSSAREIWPRIADWLLQNKATSSLSPTDA